MLDEGPHRRSRGIRRAGWRVSVLRGLRGGRAHTVPSSRLVDRPFPALEGPDPLPRPPLPGGHLRRAGQRAVEPARRERTPTSTQSSPPMPWRCSITSGWSARFSSACPGAPTGRSSWQACHPDRSLGSSHWLLRSSPMNLTTIPLRSSIRPRTPKAGTSSTSTIGVPISVTSSSSSSARRAPSRIPPSRSRTAWAGGWRPPPRF